jgi:hypothetical protein
MKNNFVILILLIANGCISYPKEYLVANSIPDYRSLDRDERIVFFEVQFTEIFALESEKNKVLSLVLEPHKNPKLREPDFWLRYAVTDSKNSVRRGLVFEFVKDYLYSDRVIKSLKENSNTESPEFYENLPEKRIAYFKIKQDEKIRWDGIEYQDGQEIRYVKPSKQLFLPIPYFLTILIFNSIPSYFFILMVRK